MQANTEQSLNQVIIVDFEILILFPFDSIISTINCRQKTWYGSWDFYEESAFTSCARLSDVDIRRSEFNAIRKKSKLSPFGSEYVVII